MIFDFRISNNYFKFFIEFIFVYLYDFFLFFYFFFEIVVYLDGITLNMNWLDIFVKDIKLIILFLFLYFLTFFLFWRNWLAFPITIAL